MFGCLFGFVRTIAIVVVVALIGGVVYYYAKLHPEKAPWKDGASAVREKVETAKMGAEVKAALSLREAFKDLDISVSAEKDVVTLRGRVQSEEISGSVEKIAASVPGVRQVVNFLEIDAGAGRRGPSGDDRSLGERVDDEALELRIRAAFKLDRSLAGLSFEVSARRRVIRLSSESASPDQKKRALEVARSVQGVVSVDLR